MAACCAKAAAGTAAAAMPISPVSNSFMIVPLLAVVSIGKRLQAGEWLFAERS
jgi:hypothetical protein